MKDMIVKNVGSTSKSLVLYDTYHAKVDSSGQLRVKDNTGRWSKYSPSNFVVIDDTDGQWSRIGKPTEEYLKRKEKVIVKTKPVYLPIEEVEKEVKSEEKPKEDMPKEEVICKDIKSIKKVEEKPMGKTTRTLREVLVEQGVPDDLITEMNEFRRKHTNVSMPENISARIPKNIEIYEGGRLWTQCIAAILAGKHILLSGGKASGKNTLANSLAFAFQRPIFDHSFHKNTGRDEIIGSETFRGGEVVFNPGMAYLCALYGGFGVLDEINMANEGAISVLNSILDDRRVIDVPGYDRINLHDATTFIGTMNYGYAGTRPLNEALASRFVVPSVPELDLNGVVKLLAKKFRDANIDVLGLFAGLFQDLQTKAKNAEISTASVDLRGIIASLEMIEFGISPNEALISNVVNKSFDEFERRIVQDVVDIRMPASWGADKVFASPKSLVVDMSGVK